MITVRLCQLSALFLITSCLTYGQSLYDVGFPRLSARWLGDAVANASDYEPGYHYMDGLIKRADCPPDEATLCPGKSDHIMACSTYQQIAGTDYSMEMAAGRVQMTSAVPWEEVHVIKARLAVVPRSVSSSTDPSAAPMDTAAHLIRSAVPGRADQPAAPTQLVRKYCLVGEEPPPWAHLILRRHLDQPHP
jgi:hypothetical protein